MYDEVKWRSDISHLCTACTGDDSTLWSHWFELDVTVLCSWVREAAAVIWSCQISISWWTLITSTFKGITDNEWGEQKLWRLRFDEGFEGFAFDEWISSNFYFYQRDLSEHAVKEEKQTSGTSAVHIHLVTHMTLDSAAWRELFRIMAHLIFYLIFPLEFLVLVSLKLL